MTAVVRTRAWVDVDVVVGRGRGREVRTRASPPGTSAFESESARVVVATSRAMDHACEWTPGIERARAGDRGGVEETWVDAGDASRGGGGDCRVRVGDEERVGGGAREECRWLELARARNAPMNLDGAPTYCTESSYRDVMYGVGAATALVDEVIARGGWGKTRRAGSG